MPRAPRSAGLFLRSKNFFGGRKQPPGCFRCLAQNVGMTNDEPTAAAEATPLYPFIVVTEMGERTWQAESYDHAREQHEDAFPEERILIVESGHDNDLCGVDGDVCGCPCFECS